MLFLKRASLLDHDLNVQQRLCTYMSGNLVQEMKESYVIAHVPYVNQSGRSSRFNLPQYVSLSKTQRVDSLCVH